MKLIFGYGDEWYPVHVPLGRARVTAHVAIVDVSDELAERWKAAFRAFVVTQLEIAEAIAAAEGDEPPELLFSAEEWDAAVAFANPEVGLLA